MAAFVANMLQVDFESVLNMQETHIIDVFQALSDAGLQTFIGEAISVCEPETKEFIRNAKIDSGAVVSTVRGKSVRITEGIFAGLFNLPAEGPFVLTDIDDKEIDAMLNVFGKEPLAKRSGKKADMKTEYRLLHDVIHRGLIAKSGAFDAYTEEKFILMTIIVKRLQFNWSTSLSSGHGLVRR